MRKIYSVLITIILLLNSINVIAIDDEVSKALANTREEYSEYIEKAIKKTGIDENDIDTEEITVYKMTAWENVENEYGDICILLPLISNDDYYFTLFVDGECEYFITKEESFLPAEIAYDISSIERISEILKKNNILNPTKIEIVDIMWSVMGCKGYHVKCGEQRYIIPTHTSRAEDLTYDIGENEIEINKVYTIDELMEIRENILVLHRAYVAEKNKNRTYIYWDKETDEEVLHTPEPKSTETVTEKPTQTPKPTEAPTEQPTQSPKPSESPTVKPTEQPTEKPSESPTETPTKEPQQTPIPQEKEVIKVVSENNALSIFTDEKEIEFTDAKPFIDENGRTQIPIRAVGEALGCQVLWEETERMVRLKKENLVVTIKIDSNKMTADEKEIEMDTTAKIIGERTYIPLRFAGEALGFEVEWVMK